MLGPPPFYRAHLPQTQSAVSRTVLLDTSILDAPFNMLSFFNQQLKNPPHPHGEKTRQQTLDTVFSKMNARNATVKGSSTPPSLTTASSATDRSSEPADDCVRSEDPTAITSSVDQEDRLSDAIVAAHLSPRKHATENGSRTFSGETIVNENNDSREQLLRDSVEVLNTDWDLGALPGDSLELSAQRPPQEKMRPSTSLDILKKVSNVVEKTKSILGKRRREPTEADTKKKPVSMHPKRSSLRSREPETAISPSPSKKRPRFSESDIKNAETSQPSTVRRKLLKKQKKQWISHGLYVGQDRHFDARLTESKNQLKKKDDNKENETQKARSLMPMPMFAGQRLLEIGRPFRLPFDVHSPLPPGQPKPDEWKKTQKSR